MASDFYLKIDGVKGEATAKGLADFMEIASFSFGASNPASVGSQGGGSASGKVSLSSFNVMKRTDMASPTLFQMCCAGDLRPQLALPGEVHEHVVRHGLGPRVSGGGVVREGWALALPGCVPATSWRGGPRRAAWRW